MDGKFVINGTVAPGYEPVREQFKKHFVDGKHKVSSFCDFALLLYIIIETSWLVPRGSPFLEPHLLYSWYSLLRNVIKSVAPVSVF